ncbi:hypothetical protein SDJN02_12485, partial [Cucurbita argyrosperma subsp. argyrosperma]
MFVIILNSLADLSLQLSTTGSFDHEKDSSLPITFRRNISDTLTIKHKITTYGTKLTTIYSIWDTLIRASNTNSKNSSLTTINHEINIERRRKFPISSAREIEILIRHVPVNIDIEKQKTN